MHHRLILVSTFALTLAACPPPGSGDDDDASGIDLLGDGSHSIDNVRLEVIADSGDGLDEPTDLQFHPTRPEELWVTNQGTEGVSVLLDAGTSDQEVLNYDDNQGGIHFLARPSALAFIEEGQYAGTFATIHDTDEPTQGSATPDDFMGPTWWTGDLDEFDGGHHGHLDMLHNSPLGMGIAWAGGSSFWVFDGYHSSLTMYDFNEDHGLGGADHSDGETARYVEGEVDRREGVPSHMEYDHDTGMLYVADTGNLRIYVLDTSTGSTGDFTQPNYDGTLQYEVRDAQLSTLIEVDQVAGTDGLAMSKPSGLALHDGKIWVTDARRGWIVAFDMDGKMLDYLDLELEEFSINGIEFDEDGNLYVVDNLAEEILRISLHE